MASKPPLNLYIRAPLQREMLLGVSFLSSIALWLLFGPAVMEWLNVAPAIGREIHRWVAVGLIGLAVAGAVRSSSHLRHIMQVVNSTQQAHDSALLRALIDTIPDLIFFKDTEGRYLGCNRAFERFSGFSEEQIVGKSNSELFGEAVVVRASEKEQRVLKTGEAAHELVWVTYPNGREVLLDSYRQLYRHPAGHVLGILGIGHDITELQLSAERQKRRSAILEMMVQGSPLTDILRALVQAAEAESPSLVAGIYDCRQSCEVITLVEGPNLPPPRDIPGRLLDVGPLEPFLGSTVRHGERVIANTPYRLFASENGTFAGGWAEPIHDSKGQLLGVFACYLRDNPSPSESSVNALQGLAHIAGLAIERKQVEERQRQFLRVFENTTEGIIITDPQSRIIAVNPAFTAITGYSEAEALGQRSDILHSSGDEATRAEIWEGLEEQGFWRGEVLSQRKSGETYPEWVNISPVQNEEGGIDNYVVVFSDITDIKRTEQRLHHLAHHDPLTDLPNRLLFNARLEHCLQLANRDNTGVALLFLDLDRFKNINDSLGHQLGDELLKQVSRRLRETVREADTVARLGGDEFTVILQGVRDPQTVAAVAEKVLETLTKDYAIHGHALFVTVSIGISLYPEDGHTVTELVKNADAAMYQAKEQGRNNYQFYTPRLTHRAYQRVMLEGELRRALSEGQLALHYQPQMDLASGQVCGVEALLRWRHPLKGVVSPATFIPLAEETGLIVAIGDWVLREACAQITAWRRQGLSLGRMAVNLSGKQVQQAALAEQVAAILDATGCDPSWLELELTESVLMSQATGADTLLQRLRELGVWLAIDDFGTGYSSLASLKQLPIHKLKIDQSFIRDLATDPNDAAIAKTVIAMGQSLQLDVVAEGIETAEQAGFLRQSGCHQGQGFYYGKPMPAAEFVTWMKQFVPDQGLGS